jgi:hypothetical protein
MAMQQNKFDRAREIIEGRDATDARNHDKQMPAAGPHAKKGATNEKATPGAGALPSTKPTDDVEPGTS